MPAGPYNQYSPNFEIGEMDFRFFASVVGCGLQSLGLLWLYLGTPIVVRGSVFIKFLDAERSIICNQNTFPILGMEQFQQHVSPNFRPEILTQFLAGGPSPISVFCPPDFPPIFTPNVPPIFRPIFPPIFLFDFGIF